MIIFACRSDRVTFYLEHRYIEGEEGADALSLFMNEGECIQYFPEDYSFTWIKFLMFSHLSQEDRLKHFRAFLEDTWKPNDEWK